MERGKRAITSQRGGSLLQSLPSPETVHRTVSEFTPCRAHAVSLWGAAPHPATLLKKGRSKTFSFLTGSNKDGWEK